MSTGFNDIFNSQHNQNSATFQTQPAATFVSNGELISSSFGTSLPIWGRGTQVDGANPSASTKKPKNLERTSEELEHMGQTLDSLNSRLTHDQSVVSHPDVDSSFVDEVDVINRLLPYHIFQHPTEDLDAVISCKGKQKALALGWKEEIHATKLALECLKRREAIRDRWRKLKLRCGQRLARDDQAYYLAQIVLDADRSENAWLANELRTARTEADRIEREKRATTSNPARMSDFSTTPQGAMQAQYYRGYPYAYTQAYGNPISAPTVSTFPVSSAAPTSTTYVPYQSTSAIPVQLPVASLPALHALGIIPVPAASLPPEGQPQPPAVLRGSTANGTILSLEINVSLLQSTQMSGLAMVLNSLVSRSNAAAAVVSTSSAAPSSTLSSNVEFPAS